MPTVMIVDDTLISAKLMAEFLKEIQDVTTIIHSNPLKGLQDLEDNHEIDLLLVDYQMPELDGLSVIKKVREARSPEEFPIIMITATEDKEFLREAFQAGANDFLRKPVEPVELIARAKNLLSLKKTTEELKRLATTDVLTNVQTRRAFLEGAHTEFARSIRYNHDLSLVMIDADHFKQVNDTYGHAGGDDVLRFLAKCSQSILRDQDFIGRLGGEEFCICLPETGPKGAYKVADRLREKIANSEIPLSDGRIINITISVGVSSLVEDKTVDDLMRRADEALYVAKENGRNQVVNAA